MQEVQYANPFRPASLGSNGDASGMIVRQYNFPHIYEDHEKHCEGDHNHILKQENDRAVACIKKHTGTGELILESWFRNSSNEDILKFIVEYLQADQKITWTGYRIRGSVHRGNGAAVWSLELFSKDPKSKTEVYSELKAPNVLS